MIPLQEMAHVKFILYKYSRHTQRALREGRSQTFTYGLNMMVKISNMLVPENLYISFIISQSTNTIPFSVKGLPIIVNKKYFFINKHNILFTLVFHL